MQRTKVYPAEAVLRDAAARIRTYDESWNSRKYSFCCCSAITKDRTSPAWVVDCALHVFRELYSANTVYWWASPLKTNSEQEARRLALLLAAEVAHDRRL